MWFRVVWPGGRPSNQITFLRSIKPFQPNGLLSPVLPLNTIDMTNQKNRTIRPQFGLTSLALILVFLFALPSAFAFQGNRDSSKMAMNRIPNLTDVQKSKIKELNLQMKKEMLPLNNTLEEKKARLNTLETAEKPDLTVINSTIDEINVIQSKLMKLRAAHRQDVRKLLTPEQRIEFDLQPRHDGKQGRNKGMGMGRRHGRN